MKNIIRNILNIEDEAKKKLEKANQETESIKQNSIRKMNLVREQKLNELDEQIKKLKETTALDTDNTIKKIIKSSQWEVSVLEQKCKEKENLLIDFAVKNVLPKEFRS